MPTSKHNNIALNIFRHRHFRSFNWQQWQLHILSLAFAVWKSRM
jgi:hypothetical protein